METIHAGESIVASSIEMASAVAAAMGLEDETVQLYLKNIRAAGAISFKGYGRSAASMTPLDAARLLIVVVGYGVARNSAAFLKDFAPMEALNQKLNGKNLEQFLADRIGTDWRTPPLQRGFPARHHKEAFTKAQEALKLFWIEGIQGAKLPRVAVVRWARPRGGGFGVATFVSRPLPLKSTSFDEGRLAEIYPDVGLIQTRTVSLRSVVDISKALRVSI
jgi:hypothetical protein